jgi:hypothetical protein
VFGGGLEMKNKKAWAVSGQAFLVAVARVG